MRRSQDPDAGGNSKMAPGSSFEFMTFTATDPSHLVTWEAVRGDSSLEISAGSSVTTTELLRS
jgi:hypothetical protein